MRHCVLHWRMMKLPYCYIYCCIGMLTWRPLYCQEQTLINWYVLTYNYCINKWKYVVPSFLSCIHYVYEVIQIWKPSSNLYDLRNTYYWCEDMGLCLCVCFYLIYLGIFSGYATIEDIISCSGEEFPSYIHGAHSVVNTEWRWLFQ